MRYGVQAWHIRLDKAMPMLLLALTYFSIRSLSRFPYLVPNPIRQMYSILSKRISQFISVALHPLFAPTIAFAIIMAFNPFLFESNTLEKFLILLEIFVMTAIIPLMMVYVFYKIKIIKSLLMKKKEERLQPLVINLVIYTILYFQLKGDGYPTILNLTLLAGAVAAFITIVINFFTKISLHSIAIAGLATLVYCTSESSSFKIQTLLYTLLILAGVVGTARLVLNAHKPIQIYLGYFVGWISVLAVYSIMN
ncbi:MAG: hypothetical protein IIA45_02655 [Bacteroidetes bacterium]|nr:hypothetical protein [Bacteroidota bacterium]